MAELYTGYRHLEVTNDELQSLYTNTYQSDFLENEYLIAEQNKKVVDYFQYKGGKFNRIKYPTISSEWCGSFKPRNSEQYCAFDLLKNKDIPIKLITGTFGSGKSLACITAALEAIQQNKVEKILFIRNNIQVKDTDQLGAIPGTELQKMLPYVMPVADHVGGVEGAMQLLEMGKLEVVPLGFLRGRSIRNSILYAMESENLTREHLQLIMGRVDEGSQLWIDGDLKQRDRSIFEKSQGLETMINRLKGHGLFGYVHLTKSERSPVAAMADLLD